MHFSQLTYPTILTSPDFAISALTVRSVIVANKLQK